MYVRLTKRAKGAWQQRFRHESQLSKLWAHRLALKSHRRRTGHRASPLNDTTGSGPASQALARGRAGSAPCPRWKGSASPAVMSVRGLAASRLERYGRGGGERAVDPREAGLQAPRTLTGRVLAAVRIVT